MATHARFLWPHTHAFNGHTRTLSTATHARFLRPHTLTQELLDVIGFEHLTDFLHLSVFNTTDPFCKKAVDVVTGQVRDGGALEGLAYAYFLASLTQSWPFLV